VDLAFVIDETSFEHEGLLDFHMLVQRQLGSRLPAEERRHQPGFGVFQQNLHVDPRARGGLPRQALNLDIA